MGRSTGPIDPQYLEITNDEDLKDIIAVYYGTRFWTDHLDSVSVDPAMLDEYRRIRGVEALLAAIDSGNGSICTLLLRTTNPEIAVNSLPMLKAYHVDGGDLNITTSKNRSLLYIAARKGHTEMVVLLQQQGLDVNLGGDVNKPNNDNATPLWVAAAGGHLEVVKYLVEKGGELNQEALGYTPLDCKVIRKSSNTWNLLALDN
ncbi:hypothetical protein SmJEL517_g03009 [Synchytrium microbalum]|uniref:Uncharacterized protein n=1 Tax=Synchytrium microbalum TaxID=1806994 RepID=A0A507C9Z0_9FUNG|nr:uncharacterized protein SmJEL517_g03009 [Synchytrium microbalum]TPX34363.1 hypothetical protein SmJEL517_g03009 [Synchytrium microbalum]